MIILLVLPLLRSTLKAITDGLIQELKFLDNTFPGEHIHAFWSDTAKDLQCKIFLMALGISKEVTPSYSSEMSGMGEAPNEVIIYNIHSGVINLPNRFNEVLPCYVRCLNMPFMLKSHIVL